MKIHNYGSDYAYQQKLKESQKASEDVDNSVDGTEAEAGETEMGAQHDPETKEAEATIGTKAEEKEVSKKKKKAGNK